MTRAAFNADPSVRTAALERLAQAAAENRLTGGVLVWDGQGGSVAGVLAATADPVEWEAALGLPRWFANALDTMTQPLGREETLAQTRAILDAVTPGRDLGAQGSRLMCALLNEAAAAARPEGDLANALSDILTLHHRRMRDDAVTPADWRKARGAAGRALATMPAEEEGAPEPLPQARARAVGLAIEAAAWDPISSPSALSDLLRQWMQLEGLKSDEEFGWTAADDALIRAQLREMYDTYLAPNPELEGPGHTVFDYLAQHRPEVAARLDAYQAHGMAHRVRCGERACALFAAHLRQAEPARV